MQSENGKLVRQMVIVSRRLSLAGVMACLATLLTAADPIAKKAAAFGALAPEAIIIRGNLRHPSVNLTAKDVVEAKQRIGRYEWARQERAQILDAAAFWIENSDEYWLGFLPKPGAAYAYGFTGCPICNGRTGTWADANCSWANAGHVKCENGHVLPNAEHPDQGTGYVAPDKRIHYFVGQFNAWVTEQWTIKALPALAQAYLLTGDDRYAERGSLFLDALASIYKESTSGSWDYPSTPPSGRLARPWYQVARTLVLYVDYYDWLYNSQAMTKPSLRLGTTRRENIEKSMLLDGAGYCYEYSWAGTLSNGHADYLRGVLAVGCLLDVPAYVDAAVNGPFSINVMLANNIDRSGLYYETAPSYAVHARQLYITFAEPLLNLRSREYPRGLNLYDDPRLERTLAFPDLQIQMAGRRPNYGDSAPVATYVAPRRGLFNETDYAFAERLYAMASDPARRSEYGAALAVISGGDLAALRSKYSRNWLLWHAAEPPASGGEFPAWLERRVNGSWVAGMSGLALLRQRDHSALLRYGPTLNHGDPDDLGLAYYANGYQYSYDIGYGLASTHVQVGWGSSTVSHALVTVNEKNQIAGGSGSGGSLRGFASLPSVRFVDADSALSYSAENVHEYRRSIALIDAGYLVDCFRVDGGDRHDYGFGSIGTALEPFGVNDLKKTPGSLAAGFAWGERIGLDGDILGHPNQPYWNPNPGNGYAFFFNVRHARPADKVWGGVWTVGSPNMGKSKVSGSAASGAASEHITKLRIHLVGDEAEPVYADAPGLYPRFPLASYVLARRSGHDLKSTFLAVYEPYLASEKGPAPRLERVERLGDRAVAVHRLGGAVDLILFGSHQLDSVYGRLEFEGDFVYITGNGKALAGAEMLGCKRLAIGGRVLTVARGDVTAKVTDVDTAGCAIELDAELPAATAGLTAIFSNPGWTRTSAYRISQVDGRRLTLEATSLSLGVGRVYERTDEHNIASDMPHEFAKTMKNTPTRFFDGKLAVGRSGGSTRVTGVKPGLPLTVLVENSAALKRGDLFDYMDLAPGDRIRIALPDIWSAADEPESEVNSAGRAKE